MCLSLPHIMRAGVTVRVHGRRVGEGKIVPMRDQRRRGCAHPRERRSMCLACQSTLPGHSPGTPAAPLGPPSSSGWTGVCRALMAG